MVSEILFRAYQLPLQSWRHFLFRLLMKLERGDLFSLTARRIAFRYHRLEIGLYSDCESHILNNLSPLTEVGRYCSIANSARTYTARPPEGWRSNHDLFCNPSLGCVTRDGRDVTPLRIGHDVWLGHNSVILPGVSSIGTGAFVGANSVVQKEVPPYAVVVGNPARVTRFRFSKPTIDSLLQSCWWESPIETLAKDMQRFQNPLEGTPLG